MLPFELQSPRANNAQPGVMATDITEKFTKAVKSLKLGELAKDEHFTLFESVSALEIMDPKMDSGVLAERESLDEEYDVSRDLLPEEILGIIDQLLCLEMAWHLGYPLSQTLLTCVYIEALIQDCPQTIAQANFKQQAGRSPKLPVLFMVLRAYCLGLIKTCFYVNEIVRDELYYEEEDFVTNTYDRRLLNDVPDTDIVNLLQEARAELRLSNDVPKPISMALDLRLELRIAFLRAMDLSFLRKANPDSLKMPWIQMRGLMNHIEKQHDLGKPVPDAFSTKLQRRLTSTMPPRPIVQLSFEECNAQFKRLFEDGIEATDVLKYSDPQSLLTFITLFNAQQPQPLVFVRTLLQSLLFKDMVVLGNYSIRQIIDHDLSIVVVPYGPHIDPSYDNIEVPTDPRHQTAAQMEIFRQRVADAYFDLFRIFCLNRCRLRRSLCHHIQEWDMVQQDVEEIDQLLQINLDEKILQTERGDLGYALPLSSWAYLYKLRQMEWIVQLGFELSVYQPDELAGMYWYLNYLAKTRAQHGDRIKSFTNHKISEVASGYKEHKLPEAIGKEFERSQNYIRATMLDAACTWEFADGLCCLYTVLLRLKLVVPPPRPYSNDTLRYEIRMKPFQNIMLPQLPTFDEFNRATAQPETSVTDLLRYADNAVAGARKGYEALSKMPESEAYSVNVHSRWVGNVKGCLKAAIAAGIAIKTVQRRWDVLVGEGKVDRLAILCDEIVESGEIKLKCEVSMPGTPEPQKDKSTTYHDWWVVPRIGPI
ncbi:Mak10-domain-containing protein [Xylariaceae sp. FL0016]|nr:Mak10-domain-containing protein [Xylariaceae sp. FL0016]